MIPSFNPSNFQNCLLCGIEQNDSLGLLVLNERITVHVACMAYSTGVWYRSDTEESMFIPGPDNRVIFNKKCRPHTVGFGDAVAKSQLCCGCNNRHATLRCSRVGCNKSFHIPCAIAAKGKSFIFHAKMVFFGEEKLLNGSAIGVLRSGRFLVCRHHTEWDRNPIWNRLQSYISERPELVNAISIDVDLLPANLQIAVSKASQLSIFSPEENRDAIYAASQRALTGVVESLCFTDVDGSVLELPHTHWIKWDSKTWQIPSRSRVEAEAQRVISLLNAETTADEVSNQSEIVAVDAGKGKIVRKTPVAEKSDPAPAPVSVLLTEQIPVPTGLSTFVTLPLFTQIMQKVKDISMVTSISISSDERTSKVSIVISALTAEAKSLARELVEEELSKSLIMLASKNKLQKQKKVIDDDDASDTAVPTPVTSPPKIKPVPPTKPKTPIPEKSKPTVVPSAAKVVADVEAPAKQSALSTTSATKPKASEKGRGKTDGLSALLQAMKQLPDTEGPLYCGTCASSDENKVLGKMLVCSSCEIPVHTNCTDGFGETARDGTWRCAACLDPKATQCCFCETKSTQLLRRPTYPNCYSWVHTVCLHANYLSLNQLKKKTSRKSNANDDSDSDSDDEGAECAICAEDEMKMVDLQRVKCTVKDCRTAFHMSCAWLAGHKISKVECPHVMNRGAAELFLPITYRLNAFCEEHSGGHKSLVRREGLDSMVISEAVSKEAWRESNAYRKDKPLSLRAPDPVAPEAFGDDSESRSDTEDEESVESDSSDSSPAAAPTRTGKPVGRPVGSFRTAKQLPETVKAKPTFTPGTELMRPKMKIPKIPLKSRDSVVTPRDGGTVKKTITYGSIVAAAGAKAALAAAAAKAAAVTAAAASAAVAKSNYMKKSISVTPRTGESSSYSESRLPLKNPEKQAEFKAARLKKLQAASELSMAEAAEIEAVKKKHEFDEIVMKVKIQRYLQYQKDSAVMLQCFGSLLEEAFTCASQLWGNDRSLMDRWSQSESLPKLHWEYMLSEDDFKSRGFTIVINSSTVDTVQVFGMDPLEKESSGASVLKMVVDSAFAIFCGQVPSMKSDVVMLVHGEAVSGRSIGMQLAAMNIHHESCYYLVAFSRNALFTPVPQPVLSPPLPPAVQAPPPPPPPSQFIGIAPSLSMMQNSQQNRAPFIQYDTLQSIGRAAANASALQHFSRPAPPSYPHEPPPQYPQGFSPGTTARYLGNVSSDAAFHSEHDDRHLVDRSKKARKTNHEGQPSRPYSPQKKPNAPDLKSIYGDGGESHYSFNPASSSSTSRESSYGAKNHSDPHRDQNKSKPTSSRTDRITETLKDNKRKHSQTVEDERNRSRNSANQSNTTFLDRSRSSKDNSRDTSRDTSRDNSRDHTGHRPQEHSKDRPKDHNTDHSRDHQRGRIEPPNEPPGQMCKFFSMGTCKYGNTCRSVHSRPSDPKSKPKTSTERCEICGRYSHSTSNCDDKHPQRNSSYHVSRTRWADSRYGRMWKNMGHDNTQPGISLNTAPPPQAKKPNLQQHYGGGYNNSY